MGFSVRREEAKRRVNIGQVLLLKLELYLFPFEVSHVGQISHKAPFIKCLEVVTNGFVNGLLLILYRLVITHYYKQLLGWQVVIIADWY